MLISGENRLQSTIGGVYYDSVAPDDGLQRGCLIDLPMAEASEKSLKKIKFSLAKLKIGDILRNCCAEKGAGC